MPDVCTCGAQLPPDAVFCHKCGKPQREIGAAEPEVREAPIVVAISAPESPLGFQGRLAMGIGLKVALGATLFFFLPYVNWIGGGFLSAFLYRRRTGQRLDVGSGVRIGWITGLIMFAILAALLIVSAIMFNAAGGVAAFQSQFKAPVDPQVIATLKNLQSPPEVAKILLQLFVFVNLLSMAGGALGAKLGGRPDRPAA